MTTTWKPPILFLEESKTKEELLAARDKARMMLEEAENIYEACSYYINNKLSEEEAVNKVFNNKLSDEEAVNKVSTEEQRNELLTAAEDASEWQVRKRISDQEAAQAVVNPWETPAFNSTQVPHQKKSIEKNAGKLRKKPKPKPVVVAKKNETKAENDTVASDKSAENETSPSENKRGEEEEAGASNSETKPASGDVLQIYYYSRL